MSENLRYEKENKQILKDYIKSTCFQRKDSPYENRLELIVLPQCNTKCSYCYYKNYSHLSYPHDIRKIDNIMPNLKKVVDWDKANGYQFHEVEIFSGEFFKLPFYEEFIDYIMENTPYEVVIPTNGTFAFSEEETQKIEKLLEKYAKGRIFISLSIDGKYLDNETRALRNGTQYTDEFYDRLFRFASKHKFAFHPMIGAKGIEHWKENYLWYVKMVEKHWNIPEQDARRLIYLLEVRNPDWSPKELKHLQEFIEFLIQRNFEISKDADDFIFNYLNAKGVNFFGRFMGNCSRGMRCALQEDFSVRLGDLALVPCHRTAYPGYNAGYLSFEGKEFDIELENPAMYMFMRAHDQKTGVDCINCPIVNICSQNCAGACLEVNKDPFVPIKTVCYLEWTIVIAFVNAIEKLGLWNRIYELCFDWDKNPIRLQQKRAIEFIRRNYNK